MSGDMPTPQLFFQTAKQMVRAAGFTQTTLHAVSGSVEQVLISYK